MPLGAQAPRGPELAEGRLADAAAYATSSLDFRAAPPGVYPERGFDGARAESFRGEFVPFPDERYPARLASYPGSTAELPPPALDLAPLAPGPESAQAPDPNLPPDARPGVFQKLMGTGTWLAPDGRGGLGIYELEARAVLAFPFPLAGSHLVITPGYGVHWLDAPAAVDLPPVLHDAWTQFRVMWPATEKLGIDVGVSPGVFSDLRQGTDEAIRVPAHAAVAWTWSPALKVVAGIGYLDREDVLVLPFGGLVWTPSDDWRLEITAPRPKIARRLDRGGRLPQGVEQWLYAAGEWGGGTWAVRRAGGLNDVVTLSDLRVIVGWERTAARGLDGRVEIGYVFARSVEYASGTPDFEPSDTLMLRAGLTY